MKKMILFMLTMLTVSHSQAQSLWDISKPDQTFTFGLRIGHNASNMNNETDTSGTKSGVTFGVSADYNIIKSISLVSGLYYSRKGFDSSYSDYAKLSYLQVPLQVSYRIETPTGVKFHFNVGGYFAYGIGGNMELAPQDLTYFYLFNQDAFGDTGFFKRLDAGLSAGAHIQLGHILLGLTYEYGLADIAKVYGKFHNRNVCVTAGYNF